VTRPQQEGRASRRPTPGPPSGHRRCRTPPSRRGLRRWPPPGPGRPRWRRLRRRRSADGRPGLARPVGCGPRAGTSREARRPPRWWQTGQRVGRRASGLRGGRPRRRLPAARLGPGPGSRKAGGRPGRARRARTGVGPQPLPGFPVPATVADRERGARRLGPERRTGGHHQPPVPMPGPQQPDGATSRQKPQRLARQSGRRSRARGPRRGGRSDGGC